MERDSSVTFIVFSILCGSLLSDNNIYTFGM